MVADTKRPVGSYFSQAHRPGGRCRGHAVGNYIPDFCCPKGKLIIELDGSQHLEQEEYDEERTEHLASEGYRVIRFWNNDVMNNIDSVILVIIQALEKSGTNGLCE